MSVGGIGVASKRPAHVRTDDRFLVRLAESVSWITREGDMMAKVEGAEC